MKPRLIRYKQIGSLMSALFVSLLLLGVTVQPLLAVPPIPATFFGTVKINGENVADGTVVAAWINGELVAQTTSFFFEGNSSYSFEVAGDDPDTAAIPEGGEPGDTVIFKINGQVANETGVWQSGLRPTQDLTLTTGPAITLAAPANASGKIAAAVAVPISIPDNTTGRGILSYQFTLSFDTARLTYIDSSKSGTLSSAWNVVVNDDIPGEVRVAASHTAPLIGSGTLINLQFTVGDSAGQSALTLNNAQFNEGTPQLQISNGMFTAAAFLVSGTVTHARNGVPIDDVDVAIYGASTDATTTSSSGTYQLGAISTGTYSVTVGKQGDSRDALSAVDASWILQYVVGLRDFDANQELAADVTKFDGITAYDAVQVAQFLVDALEEPSQVEHWAFTPGVRQLPAISADTAGQNFSGYLFGDVTGNWGQGEDSVQTSNSTAMLVLPDAIIEEGARFSIPITLSLDTDISIEGYELAISFDPAVLKFEGIDSAKSLSQEFFSMENEVQAGKVLIASYGDHAITTDGILLFLQFEAGGSAGEATQLTITRQRINEASATPGPSSKVEIIVADAPVFIRLPKLER